VVGCKESVKGEKAPSKGLEQILLYQFGSYKKSCYCCQAASSGAGEED
jgi:hypothetical protein